MPVKRAGLGFSALEEAGGGSRVRGAEASRRRQDIAAPRPGILVSARQWLEIWRWGDQVRSLACSLPAGAPPPPAPPPAPPAPPPPRPPMKNRTEEFAGQFIRLWPTGLGGPRKMDMRAAPAFYPRRPPKS